MNAKSARCVRVRFEIDAFDGEFKVGHISEDADGRCILDLCYINGDLMHIDSEIEILYLARFSIISHAATLRRLRDTDARFID